MDTPLRRSRRLEGLEPESRESLTPVSRVKRALVEFESNPEETREPGSSQSVLQAGPESLQSLPETRPRSGSLQQGTDLGSPEREPEPGPRSPHRQQDLSLVSPQRWPESSPASPRRRPNPSEKSPKFSEDLRELASELPWSKEECTPEAPLNQLQPGPRSPEPSPGQQPPGPEPSQPLQELTPEVPGSPRGPDEPSKHPLARKTVIGVLEDKKRKSFSGQDPACKKLKKEKKELPVIPKGKPKSGRVWKDRSKKRFSQMVQDKPLHTSWQRKMKERQERKLAKDFARHLEEEKQRRRQEKKQCRAENLKRRLENERKAEIVQVIRNPAKLKRAKKKQLRSIEKRDTLALLQKQPPQQPAAKI
ncbi:coiled-coil domain-containing protein 86 [Otolemur garnettii]|uniref:Coiled-coil domain-containing protein 86 n=1 Tax=Otolemur garnettii TaxID=30611 RepID=H0XG15_OTOGA|nr:coiled-coil domain-containing protein 86 [Otolemur garnettii]